MLKYRCVAGAEAVPLRDEPAAEAWAAVDLQPLKKVSRKQRGQRFELFHGKRLDAFLSRARDFDRIDETIRQVEPDGVSPRVYPLMAGQIDDAPDLAEAPAKLAARIVGNVPQ